jgi:hypothetical protein
MRMLHRDGDVAPRQVLVPFLIAARGERRNEVGACGPDVRRELERLMQAVRRQRSARSATRTSWTTSPSQARPDAHTGRVSPRRPTRPARRLVGQMVKKRLRNVLMVSSSPAAVPPCSRW